MTAESETFERAAAFRAALARYLGLPDGKDPENVGITIGPADSPLIELPLAVAERLVADAARAPGESGPLAAHAPLSPQPTPEAVHRVGRALLDRVGRPVTLIVAGRPPVTGFVSRLIEPTGPAEDPPFCVIATDAHGDVEVLLRDVVEIKAWSA